MTTPAILPTVEHVMKTVHDYIESRGVDIEELLTSKRGKDWAHKIVLYLEIERLAALDRKNVEMQKSVQRLEARLRRIEAENAKLRAGEKVDALDPKQARKFEGAAIQVVRGTFAPARAIQSCPVTGKRKFRSERGARKYMKRTSRELRVYLCALCGGYHMTKKRAA